MRGRLTLSKEWKTSEEGDTREIQGRCRGDAGEMARALSKEWKTSEEGWWMVVSTLQPPLCARPATFFMITG